MIKKIILICVIMLPSIVNAAVQEGNIAQLLVHDNGANSRKFNLVLENVVESNMDWCSDKHQWTGDLDSEGAKAQYAMLLSALMAGKKVTVQADSTKNCPDGASNRIRNLHIKSGN